MAFDEADTQFKAERGGKGVGRFLWLRAFLKVEVDSIFREGQRLMHRSFNFSLSSSAGVGGHKLEPAPKGSARRTIIRLLHLHSEYVPSAPKNASTIAERTVEHCLEYFVLKKMPRVRFLDEAEKGAVDLSAVYSDLVANTSRERLDVQGVTFDITHFTLHAHAELRHQVTYCADKRKVRTDYLANKVPNLPPSLGGPDAASRLIYAGYVASDYLNEHVNQQRTDFDTIPSDGLALPGEVGWSDIENKVLAATRLFLQPHTDAARVEKEKRLQDLVDTQAPEYRYIVNNHRDKLDVIPVNASPEEMESKPHEIERRVQTTLKQEGALLLEQSAISDQSFEDLSRWWGDYNAAGKATLAKYITNRKYALHLLEATLQRQNTGKYSKEEMVHKLIFPLKKTSDDITYDDHNLWLLDEKLAYHHYLASDVPLNQVVECDSRSRPDLVLFYDTPIAVVDEEHPYGSGIVIFEFKRPMREEYADGEDPVQQVYGYGEDIKSGKALRKDGRPFNIQQHTPFYCYVVCDLTPKLIQRARGAGLTRTPDLQGFFGYNPEYGAYVEVIAFDKMLSDANKRNRVLFKKLGLPDALTLPRSERPQ